MTGPSQDNLFDEVCGIPSCKLQARKGGLMCDEHWTKVPDVLKYRLAHARQDVQRARTETAKQEPLRKFEVARQACVQAVAK